MVDIKDGSFVKKMEVIAVGAIISAYTAHLFSKAVIPVIDFLLVIFSRMLSYSRLLVPCPVLYNMSAGWLL